MKYRKMMLVFLVFVVLISGGISMGSPVLAQTPQPEPPSAEGEYSVFNPDENTPDALPPGPHDYQFVAHGSAWVPKRIGQFKGRPSGWGTEATKIEEGIAPVTISIPAATLIDGSKTKVSFVQFCYKSHEFGTKPNYVLIWGAPDKLLATIKVGGWGDKQYHCIGQSFRPAKHFQSLGVNVQLKYAHAGDTVTLYKALARVAP